MPNYTEPTCQASQNANREGSQPEGPPVVPRPSADQIDAQEVLRDVTEGKFRWRMNLPGATRLTGTCLDRRGPPSLGGIFSRFAQPKQPNVVVFQAWRHPKQAST